MDSSLDDKIRAALGQNDASESPTSTEASIFVLIGDVIRSKQRWLSAWVMFFSFVFFGATVYAAVQMFQAPDVRLTILWAVGALFGAMTISLMKVWFWQQLDKYAVLREVKRLEAQIARLAERTQ